MTPKEAADFETAQNFDKVKEFFLAATARELQDFIHLKPAYTTLMTFNRARVALDVCIAEESARTAIRLERHTKHLLVITYILAAITVGLLVLAYLQMKHDDHPYQHAQNYYEHHHDAA